MLIKLSLSLLGWFVLLYLSVNILGFFVRGFFKDLSLKRLKLEGHDFVKDEIRKLERAEKLTNITGLVLIIVYFFILFYFWNLGVLIAAVMIMLSRLPDLLWEIKHGRKIDSKLLPKNALYFINFILLLISFPVFYFSLYHYL